MAKHREQDAPVLPKIPDHFAGPADIRRRMVKEFQEPWVISYLDRAAWVQSTRTIIPKGYIAFERMTSAASHIAREMGFKIVQETQAPPPSRLEDMSLGQKLIHYRKLTDQLRHAAIAEMVASTGTRDISQMNDKARELWRRADNGELEISKLVAAMSQAVQARRPASDRGERGRFEREADLMTLDDVRKIAAALSTRKVTA